MTLYGILLHSSGKLLLSKNKSEVEAVSVLPRRILFEVYQPPDSILSNTDERTEYVCLMGSS